MLTTTRTKTEDASVTEESFVDVADISLRLQQLKKERDSVLKSRMSIENRLASVAAQIIGYHSGMDAKERKEHWKAAKVIILRMLGGKEVVGLTDDQLIIIQALVLPCKATLESFEATNKKYMKKLSKLAESLPVWSWVKKIRGVGSLTLANVIGETGDLNNYIEPAKVWKRLGCHPYEKNGETHMGKAWNVHSWHEESMSKKNWVEYGYVGRRRSVMFNLTEAITLQCGGKNVDKQGSDNFLTRRYLEARSAAKKTHPDWPDCHLHAHANLLMGKRFLLELWLEWTGTPRVEWEEQ